MKAYAILDGGGVKGAALAGCLKGAEQSGIEFVGYGGTSAGSIVALLASIGYTPDDLLGIMCDELNFSEFLDDKGVLLNFWVSMIDDLAGTNSIGGKLKTATKWYSSRKKFQEVLKTRGIYSGDRLEQKLRELIIRKHRSLENCAEITFSDLSRLGCKPIRIVAANLQTRRGIEMGDMAGSPIRNVLTAVRASCSYPFLFRPVMLHKAALVDGGLASNLPVWLFDAERDRDGYPLVAFDLTTQFTNGGRVSDGVKVFLTDMLETALESGDALLRGASSRLMHIEVPIAPNIRTLDFALSSDQRRDLYKSGQLEAQNYFLKRYGDPGVRLRDPVGQLEAVFGEKPFFETMLRGFAQEMAMAFPNSGHIRCCIMFPYGGDGDGLITVYQHGMDGDPDIDLQLSREAGPPGQAMKFNSPIVTDWSRLRTNPSASGMTQPQVNKIPSARKAVACVPVFDLRRATKIENGVIGSLSIAGALCIDSDRTASEAGWGNVNGDPDVNFVGLLKRWADVVGRLMN